MKARLKDLFFSPDSFFTTLAAEKVNLVPPAIIVVGGSVLAFFGTLLMILIHHFLSSGNILSIPQPLPFLWALVRTIILCPVAFWVILSLAFYVLSRIFSGSGSYSALCQNTGYGMFPFVIYSVFFTGADTIIGEEVMIRYGLLFYGIAGIIFYLVLLWCCCLWVYGIRHACRIPVKQAGFVVAIPFVVYFAALYLTAYFPELLK